MGCPSDQLYFQFLGNMGLENGKTRFGSSCIHIWVTKFTAVQRVAVHASYLESIYDKVHEVSFGSMLHISKVFLIKSHVLGILDRCNFMKRTTTVRWEELKVTTNDIACILWIPSVGHRIVFSFSCQVSPDLVNRYNVSSDGIDLKIMVRDTECEIDGGIWFIRSFILVLVVFPVPSTGL